MSASLVGATTGSKETDLYSLAGLLARARALAPKSGHIVASWDVVAYSYGQLALGGPPSDLFV